MSSTATVNGVELTRYVQATFKVKGGGLVVWVDPHRITPAEVGPDRADLVLVTHPHFDHMDPQALSACATEGTALVTNPRVWRELEPQLPPDLRKGLTVVTLREGESTTCKGVEVRAVPGYNNHHPRGEGFNTGFLFTLGGQRIYHAGDTSRVPEMGQMGPVDIALYPIGGTYTSDEEDAARAINDLIRPRVVVPMHYGYATGGDPEKFRRLVDPSIQVVVLEPVLKVRYRG